MNKLKLKNTSPVSFNATEIEQGIQARRATLLSTVNYSNISSVGAKLGGAKIVAAAAAGVDTSAHRDRLILLASQTGNVDQQVFQLPSIARYLYLYGNRFTTAQMDSLRTNLTTPLQYLFDHGTINHAAMQLSSYYLFAQYFPTSTWRDRNNVSFTSAQVMQTCKENYRRRINRLALDGLHAETTSTTYSLINMACALNILDFAIDEEMKELARKELFLNITVFKANSHHGSIIAPITRRNVDQVNVTDPQPFHAPSQAQNILWYYYGEPLVGVYELSGDTEPIYISFMATSDWRPPVSTYLEAPGTLKMNTPSFTIWDADNFTQLVSSGYICDDYAIGTANAIFDPAEYSGWQTFSINFKSNAPQNQISCSHPYWDADSGEDNWTSSNRWSPFQQMYHYDENSVVMLFDIPTTDPWQTTTSIYWPNRDTTASALLQLAQYRIPLSAETIDTSDASGQWVFVKSGNTMIAVGTLRGVNEYPSTIVGSERYRVVKIRQSRTALFWYCESGSDFEDFKLRAKSKAPTYIDGILPACSLINSEGQEVFVQFNIEKVTDKLWAACPKVTIDGILQPRTHEVNVKSDNLIIGNNLFITAAGGYSDSYLHE